MALPTCQSRGVQQAHDQSGSNGRNGSASAGEPPPRRRAWPTPGTGNRICSGTGMCGCCRIIEPGLRIVRARAGHRRQEPVLAPLRPRRCRAARPRGTREFAMTRRSTSLAVCSAPIRIIPSERPRSATSSSTSLIGLQPVARRVPVQLVEDEERERLASPHPLLLLEQPLDDDAGDEPLRAVVQVVDVDDRDLRCASQSMRWRSGCSASRPRIRWPIAEPRGVEPPEERADGRVADAAAPRRAVRRRARSRMISHSCSKSTTG